MKSIRPLAHTYVLDLYVLLSVVTKFSHLNIVKPQESPYALNTVLVLKLAFRSQVLWYILLILAFRSRTEHEFKTNLATNRV